MVLSENKRPDGFLLSEANGNLSRDEVSLEGDGVLYPGTVLGKKTTGKYARYDTTAADTGLHVAAAILNERADPRNGAVKAAVVSRQAELIAAELDFGEHATSDAIVDLARAGLVIRGALDLPAAAPTSEQ